MQPSGRPCTAMHGAHACTDARARREPDAADARAGLTGCTPARCEEQKPFPQHSTAQLAAVSHRRLQTTGWSCQSVMKVCVPQSAACQAPLMFHPSRVLGPRGPGGWP